MPSPSKYSVKNVNLVLETIDELTISDKDLRIKVSEVTGLIHPLALRQFIKSMEELDYIVKPENPYDGWMIRDRRDL
jgi:hypothetical protein